MYKTNHLPSASVFVSYVGHKATPFLSVFISTPRCFAKSWSSTINSDSLSNFISESFLSLISNENIAGNNACIFLLTPIQPCSTKSVGYIASLLSLSSSASQSVPFARRTGAKEIALPHPQRWRDEGHYFTPKRSCCVCSLPHIVIPPYVGNGNP